jgi:hypothetical protein
MGHDPNGPLKEEGRPGPRGEAQEVIKAVPANAARVKIEVAPAVFGKFGIE